MRFLLFLPLLFVIVTAQAEDIRIGIIGLDTSHVAHFTRILNDTEDKDHVSGGKVVAAFKGGSPDIPSSFERLDGFTDTLVNDYGVKIYDTIAEMCENVDAVLLESVDGRPHLEQAKPVLAAGLPVFIDKPVAGSLRDAIEIYRLAEKAGVPCWSASSLRYHPEVVAAAEADVGEVRGAISTGPASLEEHHPDLFWYGIHPTEALFTVLGTGCETVSRVHTADTDVVTGTWKDGKVGVLYGQRNQKNKFSVTKFGTTGVVEHEGGGAYAEMLKHIMEFFKTGEPPVDAETTLEIFTFMEAADESKRRGGEPVSMKEVRKMAESK